MAHIYHRIKFGVNWSRIGRDMPFCVFSKMAAAAILNFQKVTHFRPLMTLYCPYLQAHQIWCKSIKNWSRYALLCIFQDGGRRHLEFSKSDILDPWWHIYCPYLHAHKIWCKSIKNWPRYALLYIFQDGGRRHLGFVIRRFWTTHDVPVAGFYVTCQCVMISLNLSEILWFYHFTILAGKCLFPPIFGGFGRFWPPKFMTSSF